MTEGYTLTQTATAAYARRIQSLRSSLAQIESCQALLINNEKDIYYLTGFIGHDSLVIVFASDHDRPVIVSDRRYDEFLNPWRQANSADVVMGIRHRLSETVRKICQERGIRSLGIQAEYTTLTARRKLAESLKGISLVETEGQVGRLRRRKDDFEVALIERALQIQQKALAASLPQITLGMTELEFSAILEYEMKSRGAQGSGFTPIIGAGANSSIIHHMTGPGRIESGVLLVDWGASLDGYNGDLTRTFGIGEMPAQIREIYKIVLEAQTAAIAAIKPGKVCAEIDAIARNVIVQSGFGEYFGHGLGHGLGMDVHEPPFFNDLETSTVLELGMIMTVEPGIYLPGVGGVRIEDDVLITDSGCRVLSDFPKDPSSMILELAEDKTGARQTKGAQRHAVTTS